MEEEYNTKPNINHNKTNDQGKNTQNNWITWVVISLFMSPFEYIDPV